MEMSPQHFMPILFKVLFGFIILNIVVNFVLLYVNNKRLYKLLAVFWPVVLFVFIMQASFQEGDLAVTMAYSASLLSMTVISMIAFEAIGRRFPLKSYLFYYVLFFPITLILSHLGYGFTTVAMPFAIATATPLLHTFFNIHFIDRKKTTRMQKILGVVFFIMAIHCINFALFRMEPGAQLWGWLTAYAIYDMLAVLLPSIALEEANMSENVRLNNLVEVRTLELNTSLKENDKLLKVLLHDISNPLTIMNLYLSRIKGLSGDDDSRLDKVRKSNEAIGNIISKVRTIYRQNIDKDKIELVPVLLEECFKDVAFVFAHSLDAKNILLTFENNLAPEVKVLADKTSLTHNVLSNLVSNALKFSMPNSEIKVVAKEEAGLVVLEVIDNGPGISEDMIHAIIKERGSQVSTKGTTGETGQGFGLSIVRSFVDSYGGQIEIQSKQQVIFPEDHGTKFRITLEKAPTLLS